MKKNVIIASLFIGILFCYFFLYHVPYKNVDISNQIIKVKETLKDHQELIVFNSKNPFNFYDILNNIDNIIKQEVYGVLSFPKNRKHNELPLVIGVAGSYGWADHHYGYMDRYLDEGFATLTLHSFNSRNVKSTVGEQISVTIAMVIHDSYMALRELSEDPRIDRNKVGITGWSLGGGVALFTAWKPIQEAISPNNQFAAHLPIYPPCMVKPETLSFTGKPIHILIGELDDWVPAEPCEEIIEEMKNMGYNADITVYPNSHHSFDREGDVKFIEHAYSFTDCRLNLSNNGVVRMKNTGFPLSSPILQKIGLAFCAERGSSFGGNRSARKSSKKFANDFMKEHLLN